ncbi:MAG: amidase, partial [Cyanobacteria bacterium J06614_10]
TLDADSARMRAKQADDTLAKGEIWGALHGVPITIKDFYETKGLRTTAGYKPLQDYVPTQNATVVSRLLAAGAILLGKTNTSDVNGTYQSDNDLFPRVNNPWKLSHTPGGSSGGSAAAIAAGFSALDVGSDVAGSIRQPVHCCGVYGLKPTDGRVSLAGHILEAPESPTCIRKLLVPGPIARSVEDLKLCFSVIAGSDSHRPDIPPVPLDTPSNKSFDELRLAWSDDFIIPVAADIQSTIRSAVDQIAEKGAVVENWSPKNIDWADVQKLYYCLTACYYRYAQPIDLDRVQKSLTFIWKEATEGASSLRRAGVPSQVLRKVLSPNLKDYFQALTDRDQFIAQLDKALDPWDAWLIPVAATPAFTHRSAWSAIEIDGVVYPHAIANGAYLMPFNLSGHPSVVIPIGQTKDGLPIGLQIIGKRWQDIELLSIAQTVDEAIGGFQHPPDYT